MSKTIYISLPITGRAIEEAKAEASEIARVILEQGDIPISPFEVSPEDDGKDYADYMGEDITALLRCDAVWFAKNWAASKGCKLENCAACIYQKEIKYLK